MGIIEKHGKCEECGKRVDKVIYIADSYICADCIKRAYEMTH